MFLHVKDVHKTYRLGETLVSALRGVNLSLEKGDFTALIGASGSGKSTLLHVIGCIDSPDRGSVSLDGVDIHRLNETEQSRLRNRQIGFIFQSFNLLPVLNVLENVELPLTRNEEVSSNERQERARAALADVGLEKFLTHRPDQLSGGQRQRVAIARALVTQPALVLADEPTANLDSATTHQIIDLLLDLNARKKVTFLFSTHDEKLMARVSHVTRIQDGVIVK